MPHFLDPALRRNRWIYFSLFLLSNAFISYAGLPMAIQWYVGLFGIFLPLYVGIRTSPSPLRKEHPSCFSEINLSPPAWLLVGALLLMVVLRFYKLESLFRWPTLDEGWNGTLAIELSRHWSWKFFYTFGEAPPLPVWCAALLFKSGFSPAFALWFPSAVVSLLTVLAGIKTARRFFSKSFALAAGALLFFSYWPLFIGRFCHQGIWLPLWVFLCLDAWGGLLQAVERAEKRSRSLLLGILLGLGSFTFTPWLAVGGIFFISCAAGMIGKRKKDWAGFLLLCAGFFAALIPFLTAVLKVGYGRHILSLSPWGGWFHGFYFFTDLFKYFAVFLWGAFEKDPAYTPVWGGFLNPVWGAFFFLGLLEMIRFRKSPLIRWVGAAFLLFLLPGALSPNLETFRVAQDLPLLLFITALGLHSFLGAFPPARRLFLLVSILAVTLPLDIFLLTTPYANPDAHPENFGRPLKSVEKYRAWRVLEATQLQQGPGYILSDFDVDSFNDPTLSVMTYSFNAARNPSLRGSQPLWTAVYANVHYEPFLKKTFPDGRWVWVGKDLPSNNGGNMLGILPESPENRPTLDHWVRAHAYFAEADRLRFSQSEENFDDILRLFETAYPSVQKDRFLESVYWDKRASYEYKKFDYDEHLRSYRMSVTRGYPTAYLYNKLGMLLLVKGRVPEARKAFLSATQAPLDLTPARQLLDELKGPVPPHTR